MSTTVTEYDPDAQEAWKPPRNPADIPFPPLLPMELALAGHKDAERVCTAYGLDKDDFLTLSRNPVFVRAYADCVEKLKAEGASFRVKAQMQAEGLLDKSWSMIHDPKTPPSVQADLIKKTVQWANYEPKGDSPGAGGPGFSININLG